MTPRKKATYPPPHVSKAARRRLGFRPMLEALEAREACNSLYNPLFGSAFLALDPLDVPYSVVSGDGSIRIVRRSGDGPGRVGRRAGRTQFPTVSGRRGRGLRRRDFGDRPERQPVRLGAEHGRRLLRGERRGGRRRNGPVPGTPGVGAAVVIGLPGPATPPTTSGACQDATPGPAPAVSPAGTAGAVGQSLSPGEFGLNPFNLRGSGATVSALTPFVVSAGMSVPAAQSGGGTIITAGTDANGVGFTTTTIDSYAFGASLASDSAGGLTYEETYSFTYDVQTVPAATGGASVHDGARRDIPSSPTTTTATTASR